jgi:hypothetical protein
MALQARGYGHRGIRSAADPTSAAVVPPQLLDRAQAHEVGKRRTLLPAGRRDYLVVVIWTFHATGQ